jgi:hypothetical protein
MGPSSLFFRKNAGACNIGGRDQVELSLFDFNIIGVFVEPTIPEQGRGATEPVGAPRSNKKGVLWGLQVVACVLLLPWSLPLLWRKIKGGEEKV